jgi:mRNA interferase RelE/StbE
VYRVEFTRVARRQLESLPNNASTSIARRIDALAADPRPPGFRKLADVEVDVYRIRVGNYRVLYQIRDDVLIVLIVRVAKRDEATYRGI